MSEDARDRINLQRLLLYTERSVDRLLNTFYGEIIDKQTFDAVQESLSKFMQSMQDRGAITEFRVECDASINPPEEIDKGLLHARIYFKRPSDDQLNLMNITKGGADDVPIVVVPNPEET